MNYYDQLLSASDSSQNRLAKRQADADTSDVEDIDTEHDQAMQISIQLHNLLDILAATRKFMGSQITR